MAAISLESCPPSRGIRTQTAAVSLDAGGELIPSGQHIGTQASTCRGWTHTNQGLQTTRLEKTQLSRLLAVEDLCTQLAIKKTAYSFQRLITGR
jgi:hypothetical protein